MNICFEKARELGQLILESDEAVKFRTASTNFATNEEATSEMEKYQTFQKEVAEKVRNKGMSQEEVNKATSELSSRIEELKKNKIIDDLITSENKLNSFINQIMSIVQATITGESNSGCGCNGGSSCSKNCNSCN